MNKYTVKESEVASSVVHARVRKDHSTEITEDYVEAIADISELTGRCRSVDLANHFGVANATVNKIIQRLCRAGLARTISYRPIELTADGRKLARHCKIRHEIVHQFLLAIGVDDETALLDSEGLEHHVSPATLEAMKAFITRKEQASLINSPSTLHTH